MEIMQHTIKITASKNRVWRVLWNDSSFRQWAGVIDPGTYMKGELIKGSVVEFISSENGYGVSSLVEKLVPNEYLRLRHSADTQDFGANDRAQEWTGGEETYELTENDGVTTLTVAFDVPTEMLDYFNDAYPKALDIVKNLAEDL